MTFIAFDGEWRPALPTAYDAVARGRRSRTRLLPGLHKLITRVRQRHVCPAAGIRVNVVASDAKDAL